MFFYSCGGCVTYFHNQQSLIRASKFSFAFNFWTPANKKTQYSSFILFTSVALWSEVPCHATAVTEVMWCGNLGSPLLWPFDGSAQHGHAFGPTWALRGGLAQPCTGKRRVFFTKIVAPSKLKWVDWSELLTLLWIVVLLYMLIYFLFLDHGTARELFSSIFIDLSSNIYSLGSTCKASKPGGWCPPSPRELRKWVPLMQQRQLFVFLQKASLKGSPDGFWDVSLHFGSLYCIGLWIFLKCMWVFILFPLKDMKLSFLCFLI